MPYRLALLDRDGTINVGAAPGEYVETPDALELLPGAGAAIARLNRAGVSVAVVTNQRGIALGRMTLADLEAIHAALQRALARFGARIDAFYACPHAADSCACRKPQPGMLLDALRDFGVPAADAVMIGDSATDAEAGRRAGVAALQLGMDVPDLAAAADRVLT